MNTILVVAPHPDDETLGCGGAVLRHLHEGCQVHWLIVTDITPELGYNSGQIADREKEIAKVAEFLGFAEVHRLGFPTTRLDSLPSGDIVSGIAKVIEKTACRMIYLPFIGDAHSDHRVVFEAGAACSKWFRRSSLRIVRAYETPSETDFGRNPCCAGFRPNLFLDITPHLEGKVAALKLYRGETDEFPFPRSEEAIRALAALRGAASGFRAAEAFMSILEII